MAILDTEKIDFLWKKIIYGVSKTAGALVKFGSNETIPSPAPVLPSSVWKEGDDIPASPPASDTSIITVLTEAAGAAIEMTSDATSPADVAWLASSTPGDAADRMVDFVPPTFGTGYAVKVWIGDPDAGPAARIFPDTTSEEWVFDYAAGVLVFTGTIPAGKTATVGSGSVSVSTHGVYIEGYRYIGAKGVGGDVPFIPTSLDQLSDVELSTGPVEGDVLTYRDGVWQSEVPQGGDVGVLGTMAEQDADDVDITGGSLDNVSLTNVTIDGGSFP